MSGGYPAGIGFCNGFTAGFSLSNTPTYYTNITPGNSGSYGAYAELIHSTPSDASWVTTLIGGLYTNLANNMFKFAVGAAGSEKDVILDLCAYTPSNTAVPTYLGGFSFPLSVPAGTRISAAVCGNNTTDKTVAYMQLFDTDYLVQEVGGVDSMGATISTSPHGSVITGSGSENTWSAWHQVIASTVRDYVGLFFLMTDPTGTTFPNAPMFILEVAIGAAGSEKTIIPAVASAASSIYGSYLNPTLHFVQVPAGSALSARVASGGVAYGGNIGIVIYGLYQ